MGNMGSAIADRLAQSGQFSVVPCDIDDDANVCAQEADIVLLAVKPQSFNELALSITEDLSEKLVISIMAGVTIKTMSEKLSAQKIIRSMPNLGAIVGASMTGWFASGACEDADKQTSATLFEAIGKQVETKSEEDLDNIVAISGSGPAYFFYLAELLQQQAEALGFSAEDAKNLAEQTFIGAAKALEAGDRTVAEWTEAVASKGGTTEAALSSLKNAEFDRIFKEAIEAAKRRSEELS